VQTGLFQPSLTLGEQDLDETASTTSRASTAEHRKRVETPGRLTSGLRIPRS
jgi:hypothetical protein